MELLLLLSHVNKKCLISYFYVTLHCLTMQEVSTKFFIIYGF